jgi:uncharacterized membrane protein
VTTGRPHVDRSRDLERFLTFIDAIAAVAITLLILPLVDLAGELDSGHHSVWTVVHEHSGRFWAFALSFIVIARLWVIQHHMMRSVIASSPAIVWCLTVWSMAIVFLPFPTALLPEGGSQTATKVLYLGTLLVCAVSLTVLAWTLGRSPSLSDGGAAPPVLQAVVNIVLLLIALAVMLAFPVTSYFPLLLLAFDDRFTLWVQRLAAAFRSR